MRTNTIETHYPRTRNYQSWFNKVTNTIQTLFGAEITLILFDKNSEAGAVLVMMIMLGVAAFVLHLVLKRVIIEETLAFAKVYEEEDGDNEVDWG